MGRAQEVKTGQRRAEPRKKAEAQGKRSGGRLAAVILAALLLGLALQLSGMYAQLQSAKEEERDYAQQLSELQAANERLRQDIENSGDMELIEDIARDELGLVSPGEKIIRFRK